MNCKRAKAEIALWVGNDLDAFDESSLKRHLATCPNCRHYWRRMKKSLRILQQADQPPLEAELGSLWPRVSGALAATQGRERQGGRFSGWVPALAVAAGCLAMISLARNAPLAERSGEGPVISVRPVRSAPPIPGDVFWRSEPPRDPFAEVDPVFPSRDMPGFLGEFDEEFVQPDDQKTPSRRVRLEGRGSR